MEAGLVDRIQVRLPIRQDWKIEATTPQQAYVGQWAHLIGVFDAQKSQTRVYFNGMPAILNSIGFDSSSSRLVIGGDPSATNSFDGLLDDLHIWNRPQAQGSKFIVRQ